MTTSTRDILEGRAPRNSFMPYTAIAAMTIGLKKCTYLVVYVPRLEQASQNLYKSVLAFRCSQFSHLLPRKNRDFVLMERESSEISVHCEGIFRASLPS